MAKTIYIISRTGAIAAEQIHSYRAKDPNYFANPDKVLSMHQEVMGNPNKRSNMRPELKALKMKTTKAFAAFLPKFRKYATYLKLDEAVMVEELRAIATNATEFSTLK